MVWVVYGGAGLVWELFLCRNWLRLLLPASDCYRLKLGSGCVVCCMDLSITPQKGIPSVKPHLTPSTPQCTLNWREIGAIDKKWRRTLICGALTLHPVYGV